MSAEMGSNAKKAKVITQYPKIYIFSNYLTQGQVPVATFPKSHKSDTAPPPRTEWSLAGPAESAVIFLGGETSWYFIWMHGAQALMQRLLPRVPKWVGQ